MDNSESIQQKKQQRRKRKDPESRDFACKCGKSYLSYAAAYTHVKNKHEGQIDFLNNISKPDREKHKRGRPNKKKVFLITTETQKLSIVEQAILDIFEILEKEKGENYKIILEGNQQTRLDDLLRILEDLKKQYGSPNLSLFTQNNKHGQIGETMIDFIEGITKHFVPSISVKVIWTVNYLLQVEFQNENLQRINFEKVRERMNDAVCLKVWDNLKQINCVIVDALQKWMDSTEKGKQTSQDQNDIAN